MKISEKIAFITEVSEFVVNSELGYMTVLENLAYNYCLIKYGTDERIFDNEDDFDIDYLEEFIDNNTDIINKAKANIDPDDELRKSCNKAIEYKISHNDNTLDGLVKAFTKWVDAAAEVDLKGQIESLMNILPNISEKSLVEAVINEQ